jgi:hypothetical protein
VTEYTGLFSVGVVNGYGLDDRGNGFRFPAVTRDVSLLPSVPTGSGIHPAYPMGTGGSFPEVNRLGREANHTRDVVHRLRMRGIVYPLLHKSSTFNA